MSAVSPPRRPETGDFWSRRRAAVEAEAHAAEAARRKAGQDRALAEVAARQEGQSDAEILAGLGLKDPETMAMGDDFAAFLRAEVPERLRRQALRRLWRSNPVLANLDGLIDYGEDYSDAATVKADLRTAYQAGRGFIRAVLAPGDAGADAAAEAKTAAEAAAAADAAARADTARAGVAGPAETLADPVTPTGVAAGPAAPAGPRIGAAAARPPGHLRFVFAD